MLGEIMHLTVVERDAERRDSADGEIQHECRWPHRAEEVMEEC